MTGRASAPAPRLLRELADVALQDRVRLTGVCPVCRGSRVAIEPGQAAVRMSCPRCGWAVVAVARPEPDGRLAWRDLHYTGPGRWFVAHRQEADLGGQVAVRRRPRGRWAASDPAVGGGAVHEDAGFVAPRRETSARWGKPLQ